MKRAARIWLITAAVLILTGSLAFAGVLAGNHWDFTALDGAEYEIRSLRINEAFEHISIHSDTADIRFLSSEDGVCSVIFSAQPNRKCFASVRDKTLLIEMSDARKWYERIFSFASPAITVSLPQGEYASLSIEESTGGIGIPDGFVFGSMNVTAGTASIECGASASGPVRIRTGTGNLRIEDISAGSLDLSVSTGSVNVRSVVCAGDANVTVSTGKTMLADAACKNFSSNGSTGDLTMEHVIAAGTIAVDRNTGDVRLERCDAAELRIRTGTGDVTGSLLSEKVFLAQSDTGRVEVPETVAGGRCKITTDTGDIRIVVP